MNFKERKLPVVARCYQHHDTSMMLVAKLVAKVANSIRRCLIDTVEQDKSSSVDSIESVLKRLADRLSVFSILDRY